MMRLSLLLFLVTLTGCGQNDTVRREYVISKSPVEPEEVEELYVPIEENVSEP